MIRQLRNIVLLWVVMILAYEVSGQCTNFTISVSLGIFPGEVSWELTDASFNTITAGGAGTTSTFCVPDGTYYLDMYDIWGDGWDGAAYTISCANGGTVLYTGTLTFGFYGSVMFNLSSAMCSVAPCPPGTDNYQLVVSAGFFPGEVSWDLTVNGSLVTSGGAPAATNLCLPPGCYVLDMIDFFGDGWNGSTYTLLDASSNVLYSGTLSAGSFGQAYFELGGAGCDNAPVTASDCIDAVNVCDNLNFQIDPNGFGSVNEIAPPGSVSNPVYYSYDGVLSPWGTDNEGCLLSGETNSTWMIVNISQGGSLEFTFGGLGMQVGFYDWIMYPYDPATTCQDVYYNNIAPVRCNWNAMPFGGTGLASVLPTGGDPGNYETPLNVATGDQYLIVFSNWSSISTTVPLEFGGTAVVSCEQVLMPVTWTSFEAVPNGDSVHLVWKTASESNLDHYRVEHSLDGHQWNVLGRVDGRGTSSGEQEYQWVHASPGNGLHYYRVMSVDYDGSLGSSEVRAVEIDRSEQLTVFPNPGTGEFCMYSSLDPADFRIYDSTGRQMIFQTIRKDENLICIDITTAQPGIYLLHTGQKGKTIRLEIRSATR